MDIARRITFYGWENLWSDKAKAFDRIAAAAALEDIDDMERVQAHDDQLTAVQVLERGDADSPSRLLLLAAHDASSSPSTWIPGQAPAVIELGDGQYTAFPSIVSIYPDNVACVDRWSNGPGLGRLSRYLRQFGHGARFLALYDSNVHEQLNDLDGWRGVSFSVTSATKRDALKDAGILSSYISFLQDKTVPSINMKLGMGRANPDGHLEREIREDLSGVIEKAEELFDSLVITGTSRELRTPSGKPKTVEINLLKQRIEKPVQLPPSRDANNRPESEATFKAMDELKVELDDLISEAIELKADIG